VTRAELEEQSFATKRELAAIKQHDLDTNQQLEVAREKIRKLSEVSFYFAVLHKGVILN
jgi:hypothetical protein